MDKVFVAKRVAEKLWKAEAAIDAALTESAELMGVVLKAPADAGVSPTVADATQAKVMEAMRLLSEARSTMVQAHNAAYEAKLRVGIRTSLNADGRDSYHIEAEPVTMQEQRRAS